MRNQKHRWLKSRRCFFVYITMPWWYNQVYRNQEKRRRNVVMMNRMIPWVVVAIVLASAMTLAIIVNRSGWQYNGWSHR